MNSVVTYEAVIGLEVHVQLNTRTKIFCGCPTTFGASPNSQVCPVCLGLPGVLPVMNQQVLVSAAKASVALHADIQSESRFDRKNYFYPDLPKKYQITQHFRPFALGGHVEISVHGVKQRIRIIRLHLEEDAGKLVHRGRTGQIGEGQDSLVDLNRAGVPLMEIVTEPDMRSPEEASQFLVELRTLMRYLGVSDCNMEEGSLRADANVSLRIPGTQAFGVKAEIKNLNSFKFVRDAVAFEIDRQTRVLSEGGRVAQETRLWDSVKRETLGMRSKEALHDYRYFPDPDLVPVGLPVEGLEEIRRAMPELPEVKRERYRGPWGLSDYDTEVLVGDQALSQFFERTVALMDEPKTVANWVSQNLLGALNAKGIPLNNSPVTPEGLADLLRLLRQGSLSGKQGKEVLITMVMTGKPAAEIVREEGLVQVLDSDLVGRWVDEAMREFPQSVTDVRSGKVQAIGFLVGQVMKKSGGKASPAVVNQVLRERLNSSS